MKAKLLTIVGALIVISAVTGGALYCAYPVQVSTPCWSDAQLSHFFGSHLQAR